MFHNIEERNFSQTDGKLESADYIIPLALSGRSIYMYYMYVLFVVLIKFYSADEGTALTDSGL